MLNQRIPTTHLLRNALQNFKPIPYPAITLYITLPLPPANHCTEQYCSSQHQRLSCRMLSHQFQPPANDDNDKGCDDDIDILKTKISHQTVSLTAFSECVVIFVLFICKVTSKLNGFWRLNKDSPYN